MSVTDFLTRSRSALTEASERVRAKFGFACSFRSVAALRDRAFYQHPARRGQGAHPENLIHRHEPSPSHLKPLSPPSSSAADRPDSP